MMNKLKNKAGFTLIELLLAMMIMVFLVVGIGVGMDAGSRIYREATFETDSAALAGILNTSLGDILRYSTDIKENPGFFNDKEGNNLSKDQVGFVFTSKEYGVQDAYFYTPILADGTSMGYLQLKNLYNPHVIDLVNEGAYPDLAVSNFKITYVAPGTDGGGNPGRGGYFNISYTIYSSSNTEHAREVKTVVRLVNQ